MGCCCGSVEGLSESLISQTKPGLVIDTGFVTQSEMCLKMGLESMCFPDDRTVFDGDGNNWLKIRGRMESNCIRLLTRKDVALAWMSPLQSDDAVGYDIIHGPSHQILAILKLDFHGPLGCCSNGRHFILCDLEGNELFYAEGVLMTMQFVIRNREGEVVAKFGRINKRCIFNATNDLHIAQGVDVIVMTAIAAAVIRLATM